MHGSVDRVRAVIQGRSPDRTPLYEMLRNDAVIAHFAHESLTVDNGPQVVFAAYEPAIDATRPGVRLPQPEDIETWPDGRQHQRYRWTGWLEPVRYADSNDWAAQKRKLIDSFDAAWSDQDRRQMDAFLADVDDHRRRLGELFFFPAGTHTGLMSLYVEVGFEQFVYYLTDWPDVADELLELQTVQATRFIEHLPDGHGIEAVFCGDDIAFTNGPFFSPAWFGEHYYHRLARVCDAWHRRGVKVLFHSDGNLNSILDDLVAAGIDGLNPIEVLAGMDVADIHRRHPHLFMAGGIDVSQLLPFGTPAQVADTVHRAIDAAEGRIMIGSSTELHNDVPLANYLALRDAVLSHR